MNSDYPQDWTRLHVAVWTRNFEDTRSLANESSVDVPDSRGWTPVHLTCAAKGSQMFQLHQVQDRNDEGTRLGREFPGLVHDTNERATAMGILEILLEHRPNLNHSALGFGTPLHCAASSGWLSHAKALVERGAPVYTGPSCSPLCWLNPDAPESNPVGLYLRDKLGKRGLAMIEADHARIRGNTKNDMSPMEVKRSTLTDAEVATSMAAQAVIEASMHGTKYQGRSESENEIVTMAHARGILAAPLGKTKEPLRQHEFSELKVDSSGLCQTCGAMSIEKLINPPGYLHSSSLEALQRSARWCIFCKIIHKALIENRTQTPSERNQVIIGMSNGNRTHRGLCNDPSILRTLDIKVKAGCDCSSRAVSEGYSECRGMCDNVLEVLVTIFSKKALSLVVPYKFDPKSKDSYDLTWSVQQGSDIERYPLSVLGITSIENWLHRCEKEHKRCGEISTSNGLPPLPTRVIDVNGADLGTIRLCNGTGKLGQYLCLSHRWVSGPTPSWVTTKDSVNLRKSWFSMEQLPPSVVDAVTVTRALGMQYIWIDSLCIIQDSTQDWDLESSKMASVYANALMTIFADCSSSDDQGFLLPRNTCSSTSIIIPSMEDEEIRLSLRQSSNGTYESVQKDLFRNNVEYSYLGNRAWIFQEKFLSRRRLHFGKDQMFWHCKEGTYAEDGHIVSERGLRQCGESLPQFAGMTESSVLYSNSLVLQDDFDSQWKSLVNAYSTMKLTRNEDKLPALSGLANIFGLRTKNNEYIAGLWRQSLPICLAWSITNKKPEKAHGHKQYQDHSFVHESQLFPRPADNRAPSFSWAAVDGEIEFHSGGDPRAEIKSVSLEPSFPGNLYGRMKKCSLTILGPLRRGISYGCFPQDLGGRKRGYIPVCDEDSWPFGYMLPDSIEDRDIRDIYCLQLSEKLFLILVPAAEQDALSLKLRRVGLGRMTSQGADFFTEAELTTIEIV